MNNFSSTAIGTAKSNNGNEDMNEANQPLFQKLQLSNGMEIFDFDENAIIQKMERMMELLDEAL